MVGGGAFLGANARYWIGVLVARLYTGSFPYATFFINILGCLLIGFVMGALVHRAPWIRPFAVIGILGGFTTFSSFGFETLFLVKDGYWLQAFGYVAGSVVLGCLATWGGWAAARAMVA